uniref:Uncharacterized protein n=1 Tax=Avena sativa TaxID=4498 RepID=A0ACD5UZS5_AVESA
MACLAVIEGAIRVGANHIIFESDSTNLVCALKTTSFDKATIGVLVKEARILCILNFDSSLFSFGRRACNTVAYEFAKLGASRESQDSVWVDVTPSCIVSLLASDSAVPEV